MANTNRITRTKSDIHYQILKDQFTTMGDNTSPQCIYGHGQKNSLSCTNVRDSTY